MATYKEHCDDCMQVLGKPWACVHRWLDEFAYSNGVFRPEHRIARHHKQGVSEVRRLWGEDAAAAAVIHIRKDWAGDLPDAMMVQKWTLMGNKASTKDGAPVLTDD